MKERTIKNRPSFLAVIKGSVISLCVCMALILTFAFLLRFTAIPESIILPVNQVIKGVSIFLGVFLGLKHIKENGLFVGLLIGFCFTIMAFFVFSVLNGSFSFDTSLLLDLVFSGIIGAICGIICVNLKKF